MSKIKNDGLDQYGAEPLERQQFGTAGVEGVNGLGGESARTYRSRFHRSRLDIHWCHHIATP